MQQQPATFGRVLGNARDSQVRFAHNHRHVHVSARSDYALRALVELAAASPRPVTREHLATAQHIPIKFLANILQQLRTAGLVRTLRGAEGGDRLARPPDQITVADVIRAVDGPLANVRGDSPESVAYEGAAEPLREVWIAVRASLRNVLEQVTLQDITSNHLPPVVKELAANPYAWQPAERGPRTRWNDEATDTVTLGGAAETAPGDV